MITTWARNWWALLLRGIAAILFGILILVSPGMGLAALVVLFALYALVDGAFNLVGAIRGARQHQRWGVLLVEGVVSIGAGIVALVWPGITALVLLFWIAAWAIVTGALEIAAAIELRKAVRGEWLLVLAGLASIAFGVLVMVYPGAGALAVLAWIAAYAILFGCLLVALGFRLRSWIGHEIQPPAPRTAVPV